MYTPPDTAECEWRKKFTPTEFLPNEFSPNRFFAEQIFCRTKFSPNINFAEKKFRRTEVSLESSPNVSVEAPREVEDKQQIVNIALMSNTNSFWI